MLSLVALAVAGVFLVPRYAASPVSQDPPPAASQTAQDSARNPHPPRAAAQSFEGVRLATDLESASDYSLLLAQSMPAARDGDIDALNRVVSVYEYCSLFSQSPEKFRGHVEYMSNASPAARQALQRIGMKVEQRCRNVDGGAAITPEKLREWQGIAADAGSLLAATKIAVASPLEISPAERGKVIEAVAATGDPELILQAAPLLAFPVESAAVKGSTGGNEIASFAWELAACRRGANCKSGQNHMDIICLGGGPCNYPDYETAIRRAAVPQDSSGILEREIKAVDDYLRSMEVES